MKAKQLAGQPVTTGFIVRKRWFTGKENPDKKDHPPQQTYSGKDKSR